MDSSLHLGRTDHRGLARAENLMSEQGNVNDSPPDPAERDRLGFSRLALSLIGLVAVLAFLVWVFLPW